MEADLCLPSASGLANDMPLHIECRLCKGRSRSPWPLWLLWKGIVAGFTPCLGTGVKICSSMYLCQFLYFILRFNPSRVLLKSDIRNPIMVDQISFSKELTCRLIYHKRKCSRTCFYVQVRANSNPRGWFGDENPCGKAAARTQVCHGAKAFSESFESKAFDSHLKPRNAAFDSGFLWYQCSARVKIIDPIWIWHDQVTGCGQIPHAVWTGWESDGTNNVALVRHRREVCSCYSITQNLSSRNIRRASYDTQPHVSGERLQLRHYVD